MSDTALKKCSIPGCGGEGYVTQEATPACKHRYIVCEKCGLVAREDHWQALPRPSAELGEIALQLRRKTIDVCDKHETDSRDAQFLFWCVDQIESIAAPETQEPTMPPGTWVVHHRDYPPLLCDTLQEAASAAQKSGSRVVTFYGPRPQQQSPPTPGLVDDVHALIAAAQTLPGGETAEMIEDGLRRLARCLEPYQPGETVAEVVGEIRKYTVADTADGPVELEGNQHVDCDTLRRWISSLSRASVGPAEVFVPFHRAAGYPHGATLGTYATKEAATKAVWKHCNDMEDAVKAGEISVATPPGDWQFARITVHGAQPKQECIKCRDSGVVGSCEGDAMDCDCGANPDAHPCDDCDFQERAEKAEMAFEEADADRDRWVDFVEQMANLCGCEREWSSGHDHRECLERSIRRMLAQPKQEGGCSGCPAQGSDVECRHQRVCPGDDPTAWVYEQACEALRQCKAKHAETEEVNAEYRTTIAQQQVDLANAEERLRQAADDCDDCEHAERYERVCGEREELRRKLDAHFADSAKTVEQFTELKSECDELSRKLETAEAELDAAVTFRKSRERELGNIIAEQDREIERLRENHDDDEPSDSGELPGCPDCGELKKRTRDGKCQYSCDCIAEFLTVRWFYEPDWLRHVAERTVCRECKELPAVSENGTLWCEAINCGDDDATEEHTPAEWIDRNEVKDEGSAKQDANTKRQMGNRAPDASAAGDEVVAVLADSDKQGARGEVGPVAPALERARVHASRLDDPEEGRDAKILHVAIALEAILDHLEGEQEMLSVRQDVRRRGIQSIFGRLDALETRLDAADKRREQARKYRGKEWLAHAVSALSGR